jgi:hypothetical protein
MLTQEKAKELFSYNPEEGILRWRVRPSGRNTTLIAGYLKESPNKPTYWVVMVNYKNYKVHQIIWVYMTGEWPSRWIDHKDLDGTNNKWDNLRLATPSQNMMNTGIRKNNSTGVKGVSLDHRRGKFRVRLNVNGTALWLGYFDTLDAAKAARIVAAQQHHGEFARQ